MSPKVSSIRIARLCALLVLGTAGLPQHSATADPVEGRIFTYKQPDGSKIDVRVWGDEFYHIVESLDGYALVQDEDTKAACYADLSANGDELVSTGVWVGQNVPEALKSRKHLRISRKSLYAKVAAARARLDEDRPAYLKDMDKSAMSVPPNNGSVQGITILVDFSDQPATIPASSIDAFCNQIGYTGYGNNGSVRDYFYDVSEGNLDYTNFVPSTYFRAPQTKAYYDDSSVPCCSRARSMVLAALNDLNNQGFDFSQYDSNGDGLIDAINVFYAGTRNGPWSYGLWPHSGSLSWSADGVSANRYQITDIGTSLRIRTFCHENGHMICYWPDLYDYGYESTGVGNFCLMCYGASDTNPAEPCAYLKYDAGWSVPTVLSGVQLGLFAPAGINTMFKYNNPSKPNEYYLIENRQKFGRDQYIPDAGLAIWHIDEFGSNNNEQMTPSQHYEVTLVQADGAWDLENDRDYGDSTDLWAAPGYTECSTDTDPNTNWWDGSESGLSISGISVISPTMTFDSGVGLDCNNNGIADDQDILNGTSSDTNGNGFPDECECASVPAAVQAEAPMTAKSRYLSFTPTNPGSQTAVRITAVSLPAPYDALDGESMWVDEAQTVSENSGAVDPADAPGSPTFQAATLTCDPYYTDWGSVGTVHVYHRLIVPGGIYKVEAIDVSCNPVANTAYSQPLYMETSRWCDVVENCTTNPCGPPDGVVSVPTDVVSLVDKFQNHAGAPDKARCDMVPETPDFKIDISEITQALNAFAGAAYPYPVIAPPCSP